MNLLQDLGYDTRSPEVVEARRLALEGEGDWLLEPADESVVGDD